MEKTLQKSLQVIKRLTRSSPLRLILPDTWSPKGPRITDWSQDKIVAVVYLSDLAHEMEGIQYIHEAFRKLWRLPKPYRLTITSHHWKRLAPCLPKECQVTLPLDPAFKANSLFIAQRSGFFESSQTFLILQNELGIAEVTLTYILEHDLLLF